MFDALFLHEKVCSVKIMGGGHDTNVFLDPFGGGEHDGAFKNNGKHPQ